MAMSMDSVYLSADTLQLLKLQKIGSVTAMIFFTWNAGVISVNSLIATTLVSYHFP